MTENSFKEKAKAFYAKVRGIKHIEIILALFVAAVILVIYLAVSAGSAKTTDENPTAATGGSLIAETENRLKNILGEIEGAGSVSVLITYESTSETVYAMTTNTSENSSSSNGGGSNMSTVTQTPVVVTNNGKSELIVVKELMPKILGVVVVAEGASNIKTRLALLSATATALNVDADLIEIFTKK